MAFTFTSQQVIDIQNLLSAARVLQQVPALSFREYICDHKMVTEFIQQLKISS